MRLGTALVATVLALAAAGCGGDEPSEPLGPVGEDAEPSATASPGDPTPTAEETPFDNTGNQALRGQVEADTPAEQEVADAWFAYWDARTNSFFRVRVDPASGKVAAGPAVADVVQYVTYLRGEKLRTVGDTRFAVTDIEVSGATATLRSCGVNKSIDTRRNGRPAEQLEPFYNFSGALTLSGGTWRVIRAEVESKNPCQA